MREGSEPVFQQFTARILVARSTSSAVSLPGSTIIATSQAYNTAANKWTTAAPLPTAVTDGTGAVVNGILYVIGGYNGTNTLNTVYAYNPSTNTWTSKAS